MNTQAEIIAHHSKTGWNVTRSKKAAVVFASRICPRGTGRLHVKAWAGSGRKEAWNLLFRTRENAIAYAAQLVANVAARTTRRAAVKAERATKRAALRASDFWTVGDVVYTSWGYDQTNVEFYQITEVKAKTVIVQQVHANSSDNGQPGGGKAAPRRFEFTGNPITCPLREDGGFTAGPCRGKETRPSFRNYCHKWTGRALYCSSDR